MLLIVWRRTKTQEHAVLSHLDGSLLVPAGPIKRFLNESGVEAVKNAMLRRGARRWLEDRGSAQRGSRGRRR
jgi:hypothetical protein